MQTWIQVVNGRQSIGSVYSLASLLENLVKITEVDSLSETGKLSFSLVERPSSDRHGSRSSSRYLPPPVSVGAAFAATFLTISPSLNLALTPLSVSLCCRRALHEHYHDAILTLHFVNELAFALLIFTEFLFFSRNWIFQQELSLSLESRLESRRLDKEWQLLLLKILSEKQRTLVETAVPHRCNAPPGIVVVIRNLPESSTHWVTTQNDGGSSGPHVCVVVR